MSPQLGLSLALPAARAKSVFSPLDVAGLQVWLDAALGLFQDDAGTTPADANTDPVGLWQDQSGNGLHVSQATVGNKPTLTSSGINSLPAVTFTTDDYLTCDLAGIASAFAGTDKPFTAFIVVQKTTVEGNHCCWGLADKDADTAHVRLSSLATPGWRMGRADDANASALRDGGTADADPAILTTLCPGTIVTLRHNAAVAIDDLGFDVGVSSHDRLSVGALARSTVIQFWEGHVAELLVWNVELTAGQISQVEAYLANKYRIALA